MGFGDDCLFRIRRDLLQKFSRLEFFAQVLLEKGRKDGQTFLKGLRGEGDSAYLFQGEGMGEEQSLDGSQRNRNQAGKARCASGADDPAFAGTEEESLPGKLLLAVGAMFELRLVAQAGEKANFKNPLDFFLEHPFIDEGQKGNQKPKKGLVLDLLCGHFIDQLDEIAGPGQFFDIFPETVEGADQVAVAQADEAGSLFFKKSNLHIGGDLQSDPESLSRPLGSLGDSLHLPEVEGVKGDDLIRLAVRQSVENDRRSLVEGHEKS